MAAGFVDRCSQSILSGFDSRRWMATGLDESIVQLILSGFCSSIWMAASLLWILDAANNLTMEPYRAFVSDKLPTVVCHCCYC